MNVQRTLKLAGGTLIVVASINAWSQSSEPATSTESATSAAPSKSDIRKANRALSKKVLQALSKGGVDTSGVRVLVKGSAITLAGNVPESAQIEKAGELAKHVSGVTSVKNTLAVHEGGQ
ncbi:BON domain-containing protein [Paraburkholderia sp. ZP32-5]|uniref:BON domain-containing protein n=1 Tax=Paraburkholderia sp. ZP32-5 TaxID=2883245 RepID=UPI001F41F611|nr:BON domain-containing protein [Paraburkholderia sp. ZP32-5]